MFAECALDEDEDFSGLRPLCSLWLLRRGD